MLGARDPHGKIWIMGVMNITPDSFYDGGRDWTGDTARLRAAQLVADGATLLDIGGESSRPGAAPVGAACEWARVGPVLEALADLSVPRSVDTWRAETAARALALGATMINDITALRGDPAMAGVIAGAGCACVLMHMRGTPQTMQEAPQYDDVVAEICAFFEERLEAACRAGIREENLWLDPGFGFGKTVAHNLTLLNRLDAFRQFGRPLLVGTSNKSTIGAVLDLPVDQRTEGTAATVAAAILRGADAVRVHDVRAMARVARMTEAILAGDAPAAQPSKEIPDHV
jgi:dihydropteroate synthase